MIDFNGYPDWMVAWNLLLVAVSVAFAMGLKRIAAHRTWKTMSILRRFSMAGLFMLWILFFPNTAYLITMVRHLGDYCAGQYDPVEQVCLNGGWLVPFFFVYALAGAVAYRHGLQTVTALLRRLFGVWAGRLFPMGMIPLTAVGVMMGLVVRLNSWDVLHPIRLAREVAWLFTQEHIGYNLLAYIAALAVIYYFKQS